MEWTPRVRAAFGSRLAGLGNDVRYALQLIRRQWGHTCVVALTMALGAGGVRLTRQLLVENAIVGQIGGLVGLLFAVWLVRLLPAILPADFPRVADVAIDLPSLRDQDKHVEALRATSAIVKRLSRAIAEQTGAVGELPAALLRRAFSLGM